MLHTCVIVIYCHFFIYKVRISTSTRLGNPYIYCRCDVIWNVVVFPFWPDLSNHSGESSDVRVSKLGRWIGKEATGYVSFYQYDFACNKHNIVVVILLFFRNNIRNARFLK